MATVLQTQLALSLITEVAKMLRSLIRRLQDGRNEREN